MEHPTNVPATSTAEMIEVGQSGSDYRFWLAVEACRQAEARLVAQGQNLTSLEARATSILSWSTGIAVGLLAATSQGRMIGAAIGALPYLSGAAACAIAALWPRKWHSPGYSYDHLRSFDSGNELVLRERVAENYGEMIKGNGGRLSASGMFLRIAWVSFALAPAAGGLATLLTP